MPPGISEPDDTSIRVSDPRPAEQCLSAAAYLPARLLELTCTTPEQAVDLFGVLLYSDIVKSTALTKQFAGDGERGVERLSQVLNDYFARVFSVIALHGGEVIRLEGDACFALWVVDEGARRAAFAGAAAAALALRNVKVFEGDEGAPSTIHRLALAAGPLSAELHDVDEKRAFLLLRGAPLNELSGPIGRGPGAQVVLSDTVRRELAELAECADAGSGAVVLQRLNEGNARDRVRPTAARVEAPVALIADIAPKLVSHAVRARLSSGLDLWLTEFRQLSVVQIGLGQSVGTPEYDVRRALVLVEQALEPLRIGVWELSSGDKGAIITVVIGLPPFTREHGARWAVEAGRKILDTLELNDIAASLGVATGEALYGEVGNSERRSEYLTGAVMMRATRLMQAAETMVLCDRETADLCGQDYRFEQRKKVVIKVGEDPIPAYRLTGLAEVRKTRAPFTGPAIGRGNELARIAGYLAAIGDSADLPVLVIEAEPGAGKSHLLFTATEAAEQAGFRVCRVTANPIEASTPYFVFRQILPWLVGASSGYSANDIRSAVRDSLKDHPLGSAPAALDAVASLGWSSKPATALGADARAGAVEDIVVHLALSRSGKERLVIAVDDVQWLDAASGKLLRAIAERVPASRLLAAARPPEDGAPSGSLLEKATVLRLGPLERDEITEIVARLLDIEEVPDRLRQLLAERAEGIPLYAEQLVFALLQHGLLEVVNRRCRLTADDIAIMGQPRSVRELIAGRIDLLPRHDQVVLKAASAVGREFPAELLMDICPVALDRRELSQSATRLASAGFLLDNTVEQPDVWVFRHRVVRDTVYSALTVQQRRPLHDAIATWLSRTHAEDLAPFYGSLAEQYEGAGRLQQAIDFGVRAAERALDRFANADALVRLERVRSLIEAETEHIAIERRADIAVLSANAYLGLSRFSEAELHFEEFARLSGISLPRTTRHILLRTPIEIAEQAARRLNLLGTAGSDAARARALTVSRIFTGFAEQAFFDNDPLRLFFYTMGGLNRAEQAQDDRETSVGFGAMAIGLGGAGLHRLARFYRESAIVAAERTGDPASVGFTNLLATVYSTAAGDWAAVKRCGEAGYAASTRAGDRHRAQSCRLLLAFCSMWQGQFERADEGLSEFGPTAKGVRNVPVRAWFRVGRVLFDMTVRGTDETALDLMSIADDPALPWAERLMCRGLRAVVLLRAGQREQALAEARDVLAGMKLSPVTLGISLDSICAMSLVHFEALSANRSRDMLDAARDACTVATRFSRQNLIGRPRALLLKGRFAELAGYSGQAVRRYRRAAGEAARLGLPLDESAALIALAAATGQRELADQGRAILSRLGGRPWFLDHIVPGSTKLSREGRAENA